MRQSAAAGDLFQAFDGAGQGGFHPAIVSQDRQDERRTGVLSLDDGDHAGESFSRPRSSSLLQARFYGRSFAHPHGFFRTAA